MPRLLAIDDDRPIHIVVRRALDADDVEVTGAKTLADGLTMIEEIKPDVVLLDILLPDGSGLEGFERIKNLDPHLPVIFMTGSGSSDTAIEAMKVGALEYLTKPLEMKELRAAVRQALEVRRLNAIPVAFASSPEDGTSEDAFLGQCKDMQDVFKAIGRVAAQDVSVLIRGESGTGKELVARALYQHSNRSQKPFLAVNCAALSETLLESELFGHEKGAFTGATTQRIGKFEQCTGGTIFLDEVGDMSPALQSKMLRLLQEQEFERVGGTETIRTDVRVLAATHRDLETLGKEGEFREDLYYRLNGYTIQLPPLRERGEDMQLLLDYFLARWNKQLGKEVQGYSEDAAQLLREYSWPGNIREMQSVVRQAILVSNGSVILPDFLPEEILAGSSQHEKSDVEPHDSNSDNMGRYVELRLREETTNLYEESLQRMEKDLLTIVLEHTSGNQSQAARILGITRGSLRNKIRALGLTISQIVDANDDALMS